MQSVRFVRNNPAEGEIYHDPQTRESYVLKNGYVHNVNVYRKPGQAPVIEVRHTLFPHVRLEVESDARALRHFGVDHPGLHKSNPSEYWKKNIQKAIRAHQDRKPYLLGDISSDRDDRDMSGLDLYGADLTRADLSGADLSGADLTRAILSGANLTRAKLASANLTDADLHDAILSGADLTGADLTGADLTRASLFSVDLTGANLFGADLSGANMTGSKMIRVTMPDGTRYK
jgi:hypothetical protein